MVEHQKVTLKSDPQWVGLATGNREKRGGRMCLEVFKDLEPHWIPEDEVEFGSRNVVPSDLLRSGKTSKPFDLRRTLLHTRLFGKLDDMIYSMEATNTDFYPHQFKPVLKLLRSPSQGILIADEVGLGKTIEAGLIWTELCARYDFRRLLVFCPAVLREKWRDELELKIGLRPHICQNARETLEILQNTERQKRGFALICSQQGLRPPRNWQDVENPKDARSRLAQFLRESQSDLPIDMLVIDEAQHIRNPESHTYDIGSLLRKASQYAVFLSATPLANKNLDLFMLLNLLDEGTFEHKHEFENILNANEPIVKLRDRMLREKMTVADFRVEIAQARAHPMLQENNQLAMLEKEILTDEDLSQNETRSRLAERLEHVHLLGHVVTRTRKKDIDIRAKRDVTDQIVEMTPAELEVYNFITHGIIEAAKEREGPAIFFLMTPQRQMASSMISALEHWQAQREDWEGSEWDNEDYEGEMSGAVALSVAAEIYRRNRQYLDALKPALLEIDSKYNRLVERLDDYFQKHPSEKVIIFSAFPGTLGYLRKRLEENRSNWGNVLLRGGGSAEDKMDIVRDFRENSSIRILLTSEVGGEGIDLQFCWILINYDMPWNPMRLEQRIGRIDRIGQESNQIIIWNLLHKDTIDERIYTAVDSKRWLEERALGDAEAVIAQEFRELTRDLLLGGLSQEQERSRLEDARMAIARSTHITEQLEEESAHLMAHGDYLMERIQDARDKNRWVTPEDLATYINDFLHEESTGSTFYRLDDEHSYYEVALSDAIIIRFQQFLGQQKIPYAGGFLRSDRPVKVCFDSRSAQKGMEIITHTHPLVKFAAHETERIRNNLRPSVAAKLKHAKLLQSSDPGIYVIAGALWKFESGLMKIEKVSCSGQHVQSNYTISNAQAESVAISTARCGTYWPQWSASLSKESAYESVQLALKSLESEYRSFLDNLQAQIKDRAEIQLQSVRRQAKREAESAQKAIDTLREKGNDRMIHVHRSRLEKIQNRLKSKETKIKTDMENIRSHSVELFSLIVLIE